MSKTRQEPVKVDLELEEGKTYKTKFQTGELFRVERIVRRQMYNKIIMVYGIYLSHAHIGLCPLDPERLIPESRIENIEVLICECCGKDL
jgi:hypothetical protein